MSMYENIALQLWSCHEDAENDLEGTLRRLAGTGINGFEHFKVTDMSRDDYAALIKRYGMSVPSIHLGYELLLEHWQEYCDYLLPLGLKRFVMPGWHPQNDDEYYRFVEGFDELGRKIRSAGADLLYHNHIVEFTECKKDGKAYWFRMAEDCPEIAFQLDCYWAKLGGCDIMEMLDKYPDRIRSLHIKNGKGEHPSCDIDKGIIDFEPVLARAEQLGMDWTVLEFEAEPKDTYAFCENAVRYIKGLKK